MFGGGWMTGGWLGLLLVAAVAALVIVGIVLAIRPRGRSTDDPIEIFRRRFARGEISADELEQAKRALGG
ncbi:MAG: SHOCT domain-containing protein [Chloroflexota bacterium]